MAPQKGVGEDNVHAASRDASRSSLSETGRDAPMTGGNEADLSGPPDTDDVFGDSGLDEDDPGDVKAAAKDGQEEEEEDDDDDSPEVQDYRKFAALVGTAIPSPLTTSSPEGVAAGAAASPTTRKTKLSAQSLRRGEKDFDAHGTRAQRAALEQSRTVLETVLSHTRVHLGGGGGGGGAVRGWYAPGVWDDAVDGVVDADNADAGVGLGVDANNTSRRLAHLRHRVVVVEVARGPLFASAGVVPGKLPQHRNPREHQQQQQPPPPPRAGWDRLWLLPEEALFLVERGSLALWLPQRPLADILGGGGSSGHPTHGDDDNDDGDNENNGIPLSLQAAYALLIGGDDDGGHPDVPSAPGRIPLPSFQVYSHLRRAGYHVMRAVPPGQYGTPPVDVGVSAAAPPPPTSLWQWLVARVLPSAAGANPEHPPPFGPLVRPGLYRSYSAVYTQLSLHSRPDRSRDGVSPDAPAGDDDDNPFRITFHVWKASATASAPAAAVNTDKKPTGSTFSKSRLPPPDFYVAVADAHATDVPTLGQVSALLAAVPSHTTATLTTTTTTATAATLGGNQKQKTPTSRAGGGRRGEGGRKGASAPPHNQPLRLGAVYRQLKEGRRSVIMAVVDHGLVNYLRFADGGFAAVPLWPRFDAVAMRAAGGGPGGRKGRGKGGGKGGRGVKGGKGAGGGGAAVNGSSNGLSNGGHGDRGV
ncbi:tRNA splicing endonuclease subunit [Niveomyces insectorum RCEF 264]|uniref:tRNA splicing endonuclease subunit n=1 Tax=Niveomyces insectorum RCEF 264 TaxID=1081102 RepID=A0A162MQX4_9HYPO|nr:tRNA splicing endonuclease subunit [Niveomyces insectorum RCEF 264]